MCIILRYKKAHRKLISNSRGFSSIVGAVFAVLVIISLTATVFVWSISQNNLYNNAVRTKNQLDAEQSSEIIDAFNASYRVNQPIVSVSAPIQNLGYLPLNITRLWLKDINSTTGLYGFSDPLNYTVQPGANATITADIVMPDVQANHNFTSWLVTGRGNIFATSTTLMGPAGQQGPQGVPGQNGTDSYNARTALIAQGIGSLAFDFNSITYFLVSGNQLTPYPTGYQSYTVPAVDNLALGFNITNWNPLYNITLDAKTIMWSYFAMVPGQTLGPVWNIVSNQSATIMGTYTPIKLDYNVTTFLIFHNPGKNLFNTGQHNTLAAMNLLFFGNFTTTVGGVTTVASSYGQNVPFVSLYFSP